MHFDRNRYLIPALAACEWRRYARADRQGYGGYEGGLGAKAHRECDRPDRGAWVHSFGSSGWRGSGTRRNRQEDRDRGTFPLTGPASS